jgi:pyruvate kinase
VMVARWDLWVDIPLERIPLTQKKWSNVVMK